MAPAPEEKPQPPRESNPAPDEPRPVAAGGSLSEILGLAALAAVGGLIGLTLISGSFTRTMGAATSARLEWQSRQQAVAEALADPENQALLERRARAETER